MGLGGLLAATALAVPVDFKLPAQSAAKALLAFSKQAKVEVLFSFDELRPVTTAAVSDRLEPEEAIKRLLKDTGFAAHRNRAGKFVVMPLPRPTGSIRGKILVPNGAAAPDIIVRLPEVRLAVMTNEQGEFSFGTVPPGTYRLFVAVAGFRPLEITGVTVAAGRGFELVPQRLQKADEVTQLEPYVVQGESTSVRASREAAAVPQRAAGNLDLARTEDGALPYKVYTREQITRSGVVELNEFFQREVLDTDAATRPPEQSGASASFMSGSSNLNLRGFGADQTVVLVNGRRLPESSATTAGYLGSPDVNLIPLSLVQQIEVLPVSASALYNGNAVGGVINIVLRPGGDATEVRATYTNAVGRFDAPQASVSLQHGQTLLGGALRLQVAATLTRATPPTEAELGYRQARSRPPISLQENLHRATPSVRSADGTGLFGPGTSSVTSVAPGADGTGGLAAFAGRQGMRNLGFFNGPGDLATSLDSLDYPYGRRQQRSIYYGSAVYDLFPWLQLGVDGTYARTVVNRGFDVFAADLTLPAGSPVNPFPQDVIVSLNETAPRLGEDYSEAHLEFYSTVIGALLKLPADWRVSLDAQYARSLAQYRGLAGADPDRWQQLVDQGKYNPLRDTQAAGPPPEFYDRALVYYGNPGHFVTLGDYDTLDAAVRVTNESLPLPTGAASVSFGTDYRRNHLAGYTDERRYADGSLTGTPARFRGRKLERLSVFGEVQAPLLPARLLPPWLRRLETDLAVRYVAAATANETNFAPTYGLKLDFAGGFSVRSSFTTSNRFPTPQMSFPITAGTGGGSGVDYQRIIDPVRQEEYNVVANVALNPNLRPEAAISQTAGLSFQRGKIHRFRASVDFVDTRKTNELLTLFAPALVNLEAFFPDRVQRAALAPGDPHPAGLITSVLTGSVNAARRHSQNWSTSLDYAWTGCLGGTLDLHGRWIYFQRYDQQLLPNSPEVDQLGAPDGAVPGLLRHRLSFGAGWSSHDYGLGLDGYYMHSQTLPVSQWLSQGGKSIKAYSQFDAYVNGDVGRWLPWQSSRYGLRAQLRVNNVFGSAFPKYTGESTGAGVQPYGDWRGRTYSLSLTATY